MMKTLTNISELPKWFSLEKYASAGDFELNDWLNAFKLRYWIFKIKDANGQAGSGPNLLDPGSKADFEIIKALGASAHKFCTNIDYEKLPYPSVHSLEIYDLFILHESIVTDYDESNKYKKAYDLIHGDHDDFKEVEIEPLLRSAVHDVLDPDTYPSHQVAFVQVNLNAPNSIILDHFERWLKDVKKNHQQVTRTLREKRYSEKDYFKWAQSGVLPYLDLVLWAELENVDISNRVIENAIFPIERQINVSEALKATTVPLSERVLSGELVDGLEADITGGAYIPKLKVSKNPGDI